MSGGGAGAGQGFFFFHLKDNGKLLRGLFVCLFFEERFLNRQMKPLGLCFNKNILAAQ